MDWTANSYSRSVAKHRRAKTPPPRYGSFRLFQPLLFTSVWIDRAMASYVLGHETSRITVQRLF